MPPLTETEGNLPWLTETDGQFALAYRQRRAVCPRLLRRTGIERRSASNPGSNREQVGSPTLYQLSYGTDSMTYRDRRAVCPVLPRQMASFPGLTRQAGSLPWLTETDGQFAPVAVGRATDGLQRLSSGEGEAGVALIGDLAAVGDISGAD